MPTNTLNVRVNNKVCVECVQILRVSLLAQNARHATFHPHTLPVGGVKQRGGGERKKIPASPT